MKVPTLLQNVYRDLRDRRMLSIAIALVVAILAVPFLMGGSGEEGSSATLPATTTAPFTGDEQLDPVVLAEAPGLRDFHERLAAFKSHNPFRDQAPEQEKQGSGGGGGSGAGGTGTDAGATGTDVPSVGTTDGATAETGTTGTGSADPDTSADTGSGDDSDDGDGGSTPAPQLLTYRINVRVGPVGATKTINDVPQLTFLPERKHPLVQYIDADATGSQVAFILNPDAFVLDGDGKCVRDRKHCQYLLMEPKDEMYFLFEDRQYRIQLLGIEAHRQPYEPQGGSGGGSANRGSGALVSG